MVRSLVVVSLMACLLSCKQATPPRGPDAAGLITNRFPVSGTPSMRVIPASPIGCDSAADVSLVGPPPVFDSLGNAVDTSALTVGRHVSVWANGTIEVSCPAGMSAERIVIK